MSDRLALASQLTSNFARFGWYSGINWLMARRAARLGPLPQYGPERPVPERTELMGALRELLIADARAVSDGLLPPGEVPPAGDIADHFRRLGAMLRDIDGTTRRRMARETGTAAEAPGAEDVPDYFRQDFHFQTDGYLSDQSALLYDVQVETLFYGSAEAMRRAGLMAIAEAMKGRDQRTAALLDAGCGTGRLLRQIRLAFPALELTGLDLSRPYLAEAERQMAGLRPARLIAGNAEAMPLPDGCQDIVTCVFLFHELPADVRRRVIAEMARVLKPGGRLVLVDSLQFGDRPGWDGMLEAFPVRFHEPYYRNYLIDDLDAAMRDAGLERVDERLAFLSKVMVRRKSRQGVIP